MKSNQAPRERKPQPRSAAARVRRWLVHSGDIREVVFAADQFAAIDFLRDRPAKEFGLIVVAEPEENGNPYAVRTTLLMYQWNRPDDAERFAALAQECGLPDTTAQDMAAACD